MSDLFWLTDEQMKRLRPFFPKSHGKPRVDERRVLSAIIFVNRNGLRWRDAPREYGPHKTRWDAIEIFTRMMDGPAAGKAEPQTIIIDATYLKVYRTASILRLKMGSALPDRSYQRRYEYQAACDHGSERTTTQLFHDCGTGQ
ncbi:IS5 family transposase [Gluconobacter sphaericus NBRC 12467]|uniref:IS5 family transposase n=1 Tax=Gluconobacter sphaericus NBRC 12467 TaxID=1307951 RepID=A0AA37SDE4_9PROT|nr:IS5 family transposase [Gluconobacter sphaericus NBRC 12467]